MKRLLLVLLVLAFYALHQDWWLWRTATPLAFGFVPAGLFYHAVYTLGCVVLMIVLVKLAWPTELEKRTLDEEPK
jgi:hypothetical protein